MRTHLNAMTPHKMLALLGGLALGGLMAPLHAQDAAAVTPYRPTVSNPAQLSAPGQLELELGGLASKAGDSRRESLPYTFKLAFNETWGVLVGGEAYVGSRDETGLRQRGLGDTSLALKHAFLIDHDTALGLELGTKLPTAKEGIGSGKRDVSLNGIFSQDLGAVHLDANLNATRLGAYEAGGGRIQTGGSVSLSMPLADQWSVASEVSETRQRGQASTAQWLLAVSYSPNPRLTIDVGVAKGLNPASQDWSLFSGLVFPLARFW